MWNPFKRDYEKVGKLEITYIGLDERHNIGKVTFQVVDGYEYKCFSTEFNEYIHNLDDFENFKERNFVGDIIEATYLYDGDRGGEYFVNLNALIGNE